MALTHKKKRELQAEPVQFKPDNPNRLFMSKSEVILENAVIRKRDEVFADRKESIEKEVRVAAIEGEIESIKKRISGCKDEVMARELKKQLSSLQTALTAGKDPSSKASEKKEEEKAPEKEEDPEVTATKEQIKALTQEYMTARGPGSKARKATIGEKIRQLETTLPDEWSG